MQRLTMLLRTPAGIASVAVMLVLGVAGAAYAAFPPGQRSTAGSAEFTSTLVATHSQLCLTADRGEDSVLFQRECDGGRQQHFEFVPVEGDRYRIRNVATGGCVGAPAALGSDGAPAVHRPECQRGRSQQFGLEVVDAARRQYQVVARHAGTCLDVKAGSQDDRAQVVLWECGDPAVAGNQVWLIDPDGVPSPAAEDDPPPRDPTGADAVGRAPADADEDDLGATGGDPAAGAGSIGGATARANPDWGSAPPPSDAPLSRAYQMIIDAGDARGYHPKQGECSRDIHARYWTWGPDGKVYPTWHPPRDPSGCTFGHEHGDDPRDAVLFDQVGWPAFGYVNEQLAPSSPASQRDEDHVGHKVQVGNGMEVVEGDDGTARERPSGRVSMVCNSLIKFHQGTHSPDAFTNNLHELSYNVRCEYSDDGAVIETRFNVLPPIGPPGGFTPTRDCGGDQHIHAGRAAPADSPDNPFEGRRIPDDACAAQVLAGDQQPHAMHETWFANVFHRARRGDDASGLRNLQILGYFLVLDPSRYYDPGAPDDLGRHIDLCYEGAPGFQCEQVRRLTDRTGERIAWDDPRSPFRGAHRLFAPGTFLVENTGPSTLYTDAYGLRFSTEPFPGAIEQHIAGNKPSDRSQGFIRGTFTDYASDPADRVRAPN